LGKTLTDIDLKVVDQKTGKVFEGTVDLGPTIHRIRNGDSYAHRNDGSVFRNDRGDMPSQASGYHKELVHPTPGVQGAGAQRIVAGRGG
jgi:filamentous hemagglutinin